MNNTTETQNLNIPIEDMTFFPPDEKQEALILNSLNKQRKKLFFRHLIISLCVAVIISIGEIIARFNYSRPDTIPGMLFFVWFVFVLYNLLSYISIRIKKSMQHITDKCQCTWGIVTEKYGNKIQQAKSHKKTRDYIPDYILFHNAEGYCSTALLVKDHKMFHNMETGTKILVIRQASMGNITYEFIPVSI